MHKSIRKLGNSELGQTRLQARLARYKEQTSTVETKDRPLSFASQQTLPRTGFPPYLQLGVFLLPARLEVARDEDVLGGYADVVSVVEDAPVERAVLDLGVLRQQLPDVHHDFLKEKGNS